jgi:hypothetical protein
VGQIYGYFVTTLTNTTTKLFDVECLVCLSELSDSSSRTIAEIALSDRAVSIDAKLHRRRPKRSISSHTTVLLSIEIEHPPSSTALQRDFNFANDKIGNAFKYLCAG